MKHSLPRAHRDAHLDALRAVAALMVIWMHVAQVFVELDPRAASEGAWLWDVSYYFDFGRIGVLIFFLISGFLIPSSLNGERLAGAKAFVIRRFFRLYPAFWLSIPLALVTCWWLYDKTIAGWEIAANVTMLQELFGARSLEGLYWTLQLELYFYALCLMLFLLRLLDSEKVLVLLAVGLLPADVLFQVVVLQQKANLWALPGSNAAFLSFMFAGALWRRANDGTLSRFGKAALAGMTLMFGVLFPLFALSLYLKNGALHPDHAKMFFGYPLATWLFIGGITRFRISWRPLAWMGKISYSMYLLHPVVFFTMFWWVVQYPDGHWLRSQHLIVYLVVAILLITALSALAYEMVEKPMIAFGKRLSAPAGAGTAFADDVIGSPSIEAEADDQKRRMTPGV